MTKEDALLHFPHDAEDDLEELFEDRLFEFKQKLLLLNPSRKLYDIHLKKFKKITDAFHFLVDEDEVESDIEFELKPFNDDLSDCWRVFNDNKNSLKLLLSNAESFADIKLVLDLMISNFEGYSDQFSGLDLSDSEEPIVLIKEPDAMDITSAILVFNEQGFHNISEIVKLESNNMLYKEAIRLSLWSKKEKHVG